MLNRDKNHVSSSPSSCAIPVNDFVLPDGERKPQVNEIVNCASSISSNDVPDDHRHGVVNDSAPAVMSGFNSKGREPPKSLAAMGRGAVNRKGTLLINTV